MTIIPYDDSMKAQFADLLTDYFMGLGGNDIPEEIIREKLLDHILGYCEKDIIRVAVAVHDGTPVGFSIYQIDRPESDWCKREGWGFIREFYIAPACRKLGFGTALAEFTVRELEKMGAEGIYLTSDDAIPFWESCGFRDTGEKCSNGLNILEPVMSG